ncbi:MAG: carbohydrate-binding domain-containing protein [Oscillospiraceae bacterium]|jgi:hypothetical protein|nr:carbohydrate-binding domain-containing protein [Oscillospiraceae bacterium]
MKKLSLLLLPLLLLAACKPAEIAELPAAPAAETTAVPEAVPQSAVSNTISLDGEYKLTGVINEQVLVTAANVTLILDNATIICADDSAILGDDDDSKNLQNLTITLIGNNVINGGKHGIQGKDNLTITGDGTLEVTAVKDGLHAGDALNFESGNVNVLSSFEGVEAAYINISGGSLTTHASDDGVNAAADEDGVTPSVIISGGTHFIYSGSDGIDSNGTLDISGGTVAVLINAPRDGETFDADRPGTFLPILSFSGNFAAGDTIAVGDFEVTLETAVTSASLILPGIADGTAYRVLLNGSDYQEVTASVTVAAGMGAGFGGGGNFPGGGFPQGGQNGRPRGDLANGERPARTEGAPPDFAAGEVPQR